MLTVYVVLTTVLTLTSKAAALSISTLTDVPELTPSATTSTLGLLVGSCLPANPRYFPDWAGEIKPEDCTRAYGLMNGRLAFYNPNKYWTFWSRTWVPKPEGRSWELPFGTRYSLANPLTCLRVLLRHLTLLIYALESCLLLFRMGKDFGDDVVPQGARWGRPIFLKMSDLPVQAESTFDDLLSMAEKLLDDVKKNRWGSSTFGLRAGGRAVLISYMPTSSPVAQKWAADMRSPRHSLIDLLWAKTHTLRLPNSAGQSTSEADAR